MSLLLISASTKHLNASIRKHVAVTTVTANHTPVNSVFLTGLLTRPDYKDLRWWGMTDGNISEFTRLSVGDTVLLSEKQSGLFNYCGIVEVKLSHPDKNLAKAIWHSDHINIFLLKSVDPKKIYKPDFVESLGYKRKYAVQGPNLIEESDERWGKYIEARKKNKL